jgi:hypothetical protein
MAELAEMIVEGLKGALWYALSRSIRGAWSLALNTLGWPGIIAVVCGLVLAFTLWFKGVQAMKAMKLRGMLSWGIALGAALVAMWLASNVEGPKRRQDEGGTRVSAPSPAPEPEPTPILASRDEPPAEAEPEVIEEEPEPAEEKKPKTAAVLPEIPFIPPVETVVPPIPPGRTFTPPPVAVLPPVAAARHAAAKPRPAAAAHARPPAAMARPPAMGMGQGFGQGFGTMPGHGMAGMPGSTMPHNGMGMSNPMMNPSMPMMPQQPFGGFHPGMNAGGMNHALPMGGMGPMNNGFGPSGGMGHMGAGFRGRMGGHN